MGAGPAAVVGAQRDARTRAHVVVIGGGIAGLAAAHALLTARPDLTVTVLEAGPRTGGKLRVGEVAGQPVDLGAEAILNRRPEGVELAREVGLGDLIVYPKTTAAGLWTRAAVRRLPRTVMGVPADLSGLRASGILGRPAVARAGLERRMRNLEVTEDVSVGRLVARRLGSGVRDRLVEPMLGGVFAGRADELSLLATMPQLVPAIKAHGGLISASRAVIAQRAESSPSADPAAEAAPVFAGLAGGVGQLAAATERAIKAAGGTVRCLATVREVHRTPTGFSLVTGSTVAPEIVTADAVVVAVPPPPAARLVGQLAPQAGAALLDIPLASIAILTTAWAANDAPVGLAGSGFLVPPVDGRLVKAVTFSSQKWGWHAPDLWLARCSVGRYGETGDVHADDATLVDRAVADLRAATGLTGTPVDALVSRWGGALPQYTVGHLDRVRRIRESVAGVPGLAVCGAAYDGIGIPACIATARRAATQVVDHLWTRETMPT